MKKFLLPLVALMLTLALLLPAAAEVLVFVSGKSTRYHISACRFLKKNIASLSLEEAQKRGYKPCKICRPPQ